MHPVGSREFFLEHAHVILEDGYVGRFNPRYLPPVQNRDAVLDLGCGPGFWVIELSKRCNLSHISAADLTWQAVDLARARADIFGVNATIGIQNAERMTFPNGTFSHVNCCGVIHHTPDTDGCVREIARVLRPGGTAVVSVYYKNFILRNWKWLSGLSALLGRAGAVLRGRGREGIYLESDIDEIVRLYDGDKNPIGKAYSKMEFTSMLEPYFTVNDHFLNFFPARTLPFPIPKFLHRWLDREVGFLINMVLTKK
jgi:ubiquinone/menaquinone biosynthesis C-methylase UbiE